MSRTTESPNRAGYVNPGKLKIYRSSGPGSFAAAAHTAARAQPPRLCHSA